MSQLTVAVICIDDVGVLLLASATKPAGEILGESSVCLAKTMTKVSVFKLFMYLFKANTAQDLIPQGFTWRCVWRVRLCVIRFDSIQSMFFSNLSSSNKVVWLSVKNTD